MMYSYFNGNEREKIARILSSVYEVDQETSEMLNDFIEALENGDIIFPKEETE